MSFPVTVQPRVQATLPPLPTVTADSGWKIAFQITGDATKQRVGESQSLSLSHVLSSTAFLLSVICIGQGSASARLGGSFVDYLIKLCTGKAAIASAIMTFEVPQKSTFNLTISESVKWEVMVQEPVWRAQEQAEIQGDFTK